MAKVPFSSHVSMFRRPVVLFLSLLLGVATSTLAGPPPGHPSATQAIDMLMPAKPESKKLTLQGRVMKTLDANEFTYVEVKRTDRTEWIAVPLMALKPGSTIRYEDGIVMAEFYSKLLQRSFANIRFVGAIEEVIKR